MRKALAIALALACALAPGVAEAEPGTTIVIGGDDAELVDAVAAELRAAGFDVVIVAPEPRPMPDAAVVTLERQGESVVVHATRPDGKLEAELVAPGGDAGMSKREVTAIQTAEAIRSLVAARAPRPEPAPPAPPEAPAVPEAPLPPPAPPPLTQLAPMAPPAWIPAPDAALPSREQVVFRLGLVGGGGYAPPLPTLATGVSLRGQINPHLNVTGLLLAMPQIGDGEVQDYYVSAFGARGSLLLSWEILGVDHIWTPSIGGGLSAEYRFWDMAPMPYRTAELPSESVADMTYESQGSAIGVGVTATVGFSFSRPWRGRVDLFSDLRMARFVIADRHADIAMPAFAPSILATVGFEYDLVREVVPARAARR
jgi:hypothetical protein